MNRCIPIDLAAHRNATGATYHADQTAGAVNAWGNSLPAEEMPFGGTALIDGVAFALPPKDEGGDHLEALDQWLAVDAGGPVQSIALLCAGEMGEQDCEIVVSGDRDGVWTATARSAPWLVQGQPPPGGLALSHVHYPLGYELDALRPFLGVCVLDLPRPQRVRGVGLGANPLFHLFALSLVECR